MKFIYSSLFVFTLLMGYAAQSQVKYIPPTAHSFSFGIGGGVTKLYGDFYGKPQEIAGWADINYNITPYLCAGIQGQKGELTTGGLIVTQKSRGFYIQNSYTAANANLRLSLGAFLQKLPLSTFVDVISGIYGGAGIGVVNNDIKTSTRGGLDQSALLHGNIKTSSISPVVPLNVGIDINMPKILGYSGLALNINYQYVFSLDDRLDGYDPQIPYNKHNDTYTYISAGFRFNFGPIR